MKEYLNGLQHLGIPTSSVTDTVAFYKGLGFEVIYETIIDGADVAFLELNGFVIETYTSANPAMRAGSIDHVALDVSDIEACFKAAKDGGYTFVDGESITDLPFFNGVRFFKIEGFNKEIIEFCQKL